MSEPTISLRDVKEGGAAWITEAQLSALVEAVKALNGLLAWADRHYQTQYGPEPGRARLALARFSFDTEEGTP